MLSFIMILSVFPTGILRADPTFTISAPESVQLQYGEEATYVPVSCGGESVRIQYTYFSPGYNSKGICDLVNKNGKTLSYKLSFEQNENPVSYLSSSSYYSDSSVQRRLQSGNASFFIRVDTEAWKNTAEAGTTYSGFIKLEFTPYDTAARKYLNTEFREVPVSVTIPSDLSQEYKITLEKGQGASGKDISFAIDDSSRFDSRVLDDPSGYANDKIFIGKDGVRYYKLPACPSSFTAPSNKKFAGWSMGSYPYKPGDIVPVKGNVRLTAVWSSKNGSELSVTMPAKLTASVGQWAIPLTYTVNAADPYIRFEASYLEDSKGNKLPMSFNADNYDYSGSEIINTFETYGSGTQTIYALATSYHFWQKAKPGTTYTGKINYTVKDRFYNIEKTGSIAVSITMPHITVVLDSGDGTGSRIKYSTSDANAFYTGTDLDKCPECKFFYSGDYLNFKLPDMPSSFTAPANTEFKQWTIPTYGTIRPGRYSNISLYNFYSYKTNPQTEIVCTAEYGEIFKVRHSLAETEKISLPFHENLFEVKANLEGKSDWSSVQVSYNLENLTCGDEKIAVKLTKYSSDTPQYSNISINKTSDVKFYMRTTDDSWRDKPAGTYTGYLNIYIYDSKCGENGDYVQYYIPVEVVIPTKTYTVSFDANGGKGTRKPDKYSPNFNLKLPTCPFTGPDGYSFDRWDVFIGDDVTPLERNANETIVVSDNVVLKARWKPTQNSISYYTNGGSNNPDNPRNFTVESETIKLLDPTRFGYDFKGWYGNADFTGDRITEIPKGTTTRYVSLYAKWEESADTKFYNIYYDGNGSSLKSVGPTKVPENGKYSIMGTGAFPAPTGYTFDYWSVKMGDAEPVKSSGGTITVTADTLIKPMWKLRNYVVNYYYVSPNGTQTNPTRYTIEDNLKLADAVPNDPEKYAFDGWYSDSGYKNRVTEIPKGSTGTKNLYCKWKEVNPITYYTITWQYEDGTTFATSQCEAGTIPTYYTYPSKASTAAKTYSFAGWSPSPVAATADASYKVTYTEHTRQYNVRFLNGNTILQSSSVDYGTKPVYSKSTPVKAQTDQYTYTFAGWDKTISAVTGDIDYYATFTSKKRAYVITFKSEGNVIATVNFDYGEIPDLAKKPAKNSTVDKIYTFKGWSPDPVAVTGDATYEAVFEESVRTYTISFINEDGTVLQKEQVAYGSTPSYKGATPVKAPSAKEHYTFTGWTPEIITVKADRTYRAVYQAEPNIYTVSFNMNGHGEQIADQTKKYGEKVTKPTNPTADGWTFKGWYSDKALKNAYGFGTIVTADITLYAKWEKNAEDTPTPTKKVTSAPSPTKKATETPTPTKTPTGAPATPVPTVSATPSPTVTVSPTQTPTDIPAPTVSATPSPTVTVSPTPTPTDVPAPTVSATPSPVVTISTTPAPTEVPVPTSEPTDTPWPTDTPTPTVAEAKMPKLIGKDYKEASDLVKSELKKAGFKEVKVQIQWVANDNADKNNTVIDQDPAAGTKLYVTTKSISVTLVVAEPAKATPTPRPDLPTPTPEKDPSFEDFVERLYVVALNRASEPQGKAFWVKKVKDGEYNGADCARFFLIKAPEFMNRGLNDSAFLEVLYKTFYDRESDIYGKAYWLDRLANGTQRAVVVNDFIESTEWCNVCAVYGVKPGALYHKAEIASQSAIRFATRLYTCCLDRQPELKGLEYWSLALTNFEQTGCSAAKNFFYSKEFENLHTSNEEYVRRLYTTFMDREPEASEVAYWAGGIKSGTFTRTGVLAFFGQSEEFTNLCRQYGIERGTI